MRLIGLLLTGDAASSDEQVIDLFGNEAAVRNIIALVREIAAVAIVVDDRA